MAEPEFTDTARAALLWVLWHHQGGSSPTGQAVRFALGMGQFDRLTADQVAQAKAWAPGIPGLAHTDHAGVPVRPVRLDDAALRQWLVDVQENVANSFKVRNAASLLLAETAPIGVKTVDGGPAK